MYRKSLSKAHISLISFSVLIFLTGCTTSLGTSNNKSAGQWDQVIEGLHMDTMHDTVRVSVDVFSLRFEPSSDQSTHISLSSDAPDDIKKFFDLDISEKNDQLNITIEGKSNNKVRLSEMNTLRKAELVVQLPAHDYTKVEIDSDVGNIHYEQINTEQLTVSSEVGNIVVQDVDTTQMNIESSAGTIKLSNTSGTMDIQDNVGMVHLDVQSIDDDIYINTDVGNVTIDTASLPEQYSLDLSTNLGQVSTDWHASYDEQTSRKVKGQEGNGGPHIEVHSSIGNINLK